MNSLPRRATVQRRTTETALELTVALDGHGDGMIATGLGFLDHMLCSLARHACFDLEIRCQGDLHVDDHHTVEDCALVLGDAIDRALGDRAGIHRFGWSLLPMDEALARVAVDLSGRPHATIDLGLRRPMIGDVAGENLEHFFRSLAGAMRGSLHIDVLRGDNDHHRAEAAFKGLALALRDAVAMTGAGIASTKGVLR